MKRGRAAGQLELLAWINKDPDPYVTAAQAAGWNITGIIVYHMRDCMAGIVLLLVDNEDMREEKQRDVQIEIAGVDGRKFSVPTLVMYSTNPKEVEYPW